MRKEAGSDLFVPPYSSSLLAPSSLPCFSLFLIVQRRACDTVTRWQADASWLPVKHVGSGENGRREGRNWPIARRARNRKRRGGVIGNIAGNNGSSRYVISCKQRLRFDDSVETAGIIVICGGQRSRFSDGRFPTSCCSWPSLTRV